METRNGPGGIRLTDTDTWSEPRRRVVEWHDPRPAAELGATLSGREYDEQPPGDGAGVILLG